ncbi:MAG: hypothetical protein ACI9JN_000778 [Bacteroidia bacterium]
MEVTACLLLADAIGLIRTSMRHLILIIIGFTLFPITHVNSWGFFAHKTINRAAIFTLPPEMFGFYKNNAALIEALAVNADKRRYIMEEEAPRHYLDADFYEKHVPIDTIPRNYDSAVARYGLDTILAHGIVPWHIIRVKWWLTKAFATHDVEAIVKLSADLGHYVGDLHVPLHSTHNYNGQLTNQHGIHGFWESRLPELFADDYDLFLGRARYIKDLSEEVWTRFEQSYAAKDSVLKLERIVGASIKEDKKYSYEQRGQSTVKTYSYQYSNLYHQALNDMVEKRLRASIEFVGSIWFTAWVDAGQPDLDTIGVTDLNIEATDSLKPNQPIKGRLEPN